MPENICSDIQVLLSPDNPRTQSLLKALRLEGAVFWGLPQIEVCLESLLKAEDDPEAEQCWDVARELFWERIHTGPWKDVAMVWRDAYSFATLGSVLVCAEQGHGATCEQCVRALDKALLIGGSGFTDDIHRIMDQLLPDPVRAEGTHDDSSHALSRKRLYSAVDSDEKADDEEGLGSGSAAAPRPPSPKRARLEPKHPHLAKLWKNPGLIVEIPRVHQLDFLRFQAHYLKQQIPVIITGMMDGWPALHDPERKWSNLDYLRRRMGHRTVPIEIGGHYMAEGWGQELMTVNEFIDRFLLGEHGPGGSGKQEQGVGYLAQHELFQQVPALRSDILVPEYCYMGTEDPVEEPRLNFWFGPGGTVSPLHTDPSQNIFCQVVGSKYVRLYSPEETDRLYPNEGLMSNTSQVLDPFDPNLERFPEFEKAKYSEAFVQEGEMLFIPKGWWHYVQSLSVSISVSCWFD